MFNPKPYPQWNPDLIPGDPGGHQRPSVLDHREVEATLLPPKGSATTAFDAVTGELTIDFKDRLVNFDFVARALRETRKDEGHDSVKKIVLLLCFDAQKEMDAVVQLLHLGLDRLVVNEPKSAQTPWVKYSKPRKVKTEENWKRIKQYTDGTSRTDDIFFAAF
jgi:hypothetical protein